jgi:hypothetical protein
MSLAGSAGSMNLIGAAGTAKLIAARRYVIAWNDPNRCRDELRHHP